MIGERRRIEALLTDGMPSYRRRLEGRRLERLAAAYRGTGGRADLTQLLPYLTRVIADTTNDIYRLRRDYAQFVQRYARAATGAEQCELVLDFARLLGANERAVRADRHAFRRWMGRDAVADRYGRRHAAHERQLALLLERLGHLGSRRLIQSPGHWSALGLEQTVRPLLAYDGDPRVRVAAFQCLTAAVRALPPARQQGRLNDVTLSYIFRSALTCEHDTWIQVEALELLYDLDPRSLYIALERRLGRPREGDDIFVRRRAVRLLAATLDGHPDWAVLLDTASRDPSAYVRQAAVDALVSAPEGTVRRLLTALLSDDADPAVRATAALRLPELADRPELAQMCRGLLAERLQQEASTFVVRVLLHVAAAREDPAWSQAVAPALDRLHDGAERTAVRRWAAEARETLWLHGDAQARELLEHLRRIGAGTRVGRHRPVPRRLLRGLDQDLVGRVLAYLARTDHSLELIRVPGGTRLQRGHRGGFRLWRLVHELRHSSPDKRQAHPHTIGRIFIGLRHAPSGILAEQAETKVPGEPLYLEAEGGWRPYLPLVDQVISTLDQGWPTHPLQIYTAEGITELTPPASILARLRARLQLTLGFARYAHLRNWHEGEQRPPREYLDALVALGFRVGLRPFRDARGEPAAADPRVHRFFPLALPLGVGSWWGQAQSYFFSVYANSLQQLALFITAAAALFLGRHLLVNHRLRRARNGLAVVIGGWGTRGKSGTERLKAALFNAMGHALVSKTTGCEAMFLYAPAFGRLREMYLFRPYDKATIWEQAFVVRLARRLDTEVFLWECMGLTPSYVRILQRQWMRDDCATITNTYPDHEDLQGPAGIEIPRVMVNFIPKRSTLITSEEQMLPILRDGAARIGTRLLAVGWLEAGLLSDDILQRFPYQEHPYNIALVLAMARELGIAEDYALKAMADLVVPDLGVLKTYPTAAVAGRRLTFVMGMSANERFGALANWTRTGFDRHRLDRDPDIWVCTVVNNRADRVPRSRVFASMLAGEISADCHLLIGSNLQGLLGYLREAWDARMAATSLWDAQRSIGEARRRWQGLAEWLRVPITGEQVRARLQAMLAGLGREGPATDAQWQHPDQVEKSLRESCPTHASAVAASLRRDLDAWQHFCDLDQRIASGKDAETLDREAAALGWRLFSAKLRVVEDYHATGDRVIQELVRQTPPGLHSRIMGMQNIKGTGLDFVYRWQAWEQCHDACEQVAADDAATAEQGLAALSRFQEYGLLCEEGVRATLEQARHALWAQREDIQAELATVRSNLDAALADVRRRMASSDQGGWRSRLAHALESVIDAGDAIRRRKRADLIYRELAAERIGNERAALELQALTKRQKGGWLQAMPQYRRHEDA